MPYRVPYMPKSDSEFFEKTRRIRFDIGKKQSGDAPSPSESLVAAYGYPFCNGEIEIFKD